MQIDKFINYDNLYESEDIPPLFVCIEDLIDYEKTVNVNKPQFLDQAIDVLKEVVVNKKLFRLILLKDKNLPRKDNALFIPNTYPVYNHILEELQGKHHIPICSGYVISYRSPDRINRNFVNHKKLSLAQDDEMTDEDKDTNEGKYVFLIEYVCLADQGCEGACFIGRDLTRIREAIRRAKKESAARLGIEGFSSLSFYRSLTEFEASYIMQHYPEYETVMKRDRSCEKRKVSNGELLIRNWLTNHNVYFEQQAVFPQLKAASSLRFDFRIVTDGVTKVIEFDGEQHYRPVERFGGESAFEKQKQRDKLKNDFCREHNIPLLRIKYDDVKNLDEMLESFTAKDGK